MATQNTIRFPEDMYARIRALAEDEHRSIHGQVLVLLKEALEQRTQDTTRAPRRR